MFFCFIIKVSEVIIFVGKGVSFFLRFFNFFYLDSLIREVEVCFWEDVFRLYVFLR